MPRFVPTGKRAGTWLYLPVAVRVFRHGTGYLLLVRGAVLRAGLGRTVYTMRAWEREGFPAPTFAVEGSGCRRWYSVEQVELAHRLAREILGPDPRTPAPARRRAELFDRLRAEWATCTTTHPLPRAARSV